MTKLDDQLDLLAPTGPAGARDDDSQMLQDVLVDDIVAALRTVHDPEIPVNIYDLGLIYRIDRKSAGLVEIDMTLTAPGCPVAGEMLSWVQKAVSEVDGVARVEVRLVFDPPWDKSRMSEEVRLELGLL